jgi:hypothetical protein
VEHSECNYLWWVREAENDGEHRLGHHLQRVFINPVHVVELRLVLRDAQRPHELRARGPPRCGQRGERDTIGFVVTEVGKGGGPG